MLKITAEGKKGEQPRIFWEDDTESAEEILEILSKVLPAISELAKKKISDLLIEQIVADLDSEQSRMLRLNMVEDSAFAQQFRDSVWTMLTIAQKISGSRDEKET